MYTRFCGLAILLAFLMLTGNTAAQVTVNPLLPQAGLVHKSQLWNIAVTSMAAEKTEIVVELLITDRVSGYPVFSAITSPQVMPTGSQVFTEAMFGTITNGAATPDNWIINGFLPVGLYQACYTVKQSSPKADDLGKACLMLDVEAMSPPQLTYPEDSSVLQTNYPQLVWMPPSPLMIFPELSYDLNVVELLPGQSAREAVQRNVPVFNMNGINENMLLYPSSAPALDTGKFYAWQIVARNGQGYGGKTDAWIFKISYPKDSLELESAVFLDLRDDFKQRDIYQVVNGKIYIHYYSYAISETLGIDLLENQRPVKELKQTLHYGDNYFTVDVSSDQFKEGKAYTIQTKNIQGKARAFLFTINPK